MTDDGQRMNVTVTVREWYESFTMSVADFCSDLDEIIAAIPEAYRSLATIEFDAVGSDYDVSRGEMTIEYVRPETDEELKDRMAARHDHENYIAMRDRAMYEALKAKFEK